MTIIYSPVNLTNNTDGFHTASASSNAVNSWLAFNGNNSDYWSPITSTSTEYLQIDLGISVAINLVRIMCDISIGYPTSIVISGSTTGSSFTTISTLNSLVFTANTFTDLDIVIPVNTVYRYYRVILNNQNGSISRLSSIQFCRKSSTDFNSVVVQQSKVKQVTTIIDVPYWNTQLDKQSKSVSGYATVKTNASGIILRPTQGQIFPRGYPIKSETITINPINQPNLLNITNIALKQITGFGGATPYLTDLTSVCGSQSYQPTGSFCNILYPDDKDVIWKYSPASGATWACPGYAGTGVLVIDLLAVKSFNQLNIFQMFSDGKITHLQLYSHPSSSAAYPVNTDSGWASVASEIVVGTGISGYQGFSITNGSVVSNPTVLSFAAITSRYLKIHVRNTGVLGSNQYIEIGGLKLFNV
jgi:hypothetical protein